MNGDTSQIRCDPFRVENRIRTGFRGRRSIAEILTLNDEIRELIVDKQPIRRIKAAAHANGTRSLRLAALDLVRRGATTIDEIKRVTLHA